MYFDLSAPVLHTVLACLVRDIGLCFPYINIQVLLCKTSLETHM